MLARMSGRHSGLSSVGAAALPLLALLAGQLGACAASTTSAEHGPSFGDDAGDGAASDAEPGDDATTDTGSSPDTASPIDSGAAADTGSTADGPAAETGTTDASDGGPPGSDGGGCTSTMALLAMGASGLAESHFSGGTWSAAATVGTGGATPPALPGLVPFSGGFLGAFVTGGGQLDGIGYVSSWSAPSQIGSTTAQGTPALAVTGSTAEVVYWGGDGKYYLGSYATGTWTAGMPVTPQGGTQSFGSSGPAAAAVGSSVVAVQSGTNGTLYDQTWTAGTWQAANAHSGTSVVTTLSPAVVALQGGTADLMIVYVRGTDDHLDYTTRTAGTWSAPAEVYDVSGNIAYTGFTPTLAALPGGGAIVVWQGGNNMAYASTYTAGTGWAAPAQIPSTTTVVSAPAVATGVCGASAIAAYVLTGGQVEVTSLTGTSWSTPSAIAGATGMQSVAVATSP
jgi:hypothetical protein